MENVILNIVCINAGNYLGRGSEYVNILYDMVGRNISDKVAYKFICFTDEATGLDTEIDARPLPEQGLDGWWNKLSLFKQGLFPDGDRIIYLDLDTVITSGLDEIIKYDGEFAILRDFYRPNGLQSSVMMWEAGKQSHIWNYWVMANRPIYSGGDQSHMEWALTNSDILQDLYPAQFVSYKVHATKQIPKGARMVIFHGEPRPHEARGWVPQVWKIGGGTILELECQANTDEGEITRNILANTGSPLLTSVDAHDGVALIIGGGPSLNDDLNEIACRQKSGQRVFSTNGTYAKLLESNIDSDYHIMLDARLENVEFIPTYTECLYASQCHPNGVSIAKQSNKVTIWHSYADGMEDVLKDEPREFTYVGGGSTVGLKAMCIAYIMGYRKIHIYGFDSCYKDEQGHAYPQTLNDNERTIEVIFNDVKYKTAPWMAKQVEEFKDLAGELISLGCEIHVHGNGLLQEVSKCLSFGVTAAAIRAQEILSRLDVQSPIGAEIGVFAGDLSKILLTRPDLTLYMVDSWSTSPEDSEYAKSGDFHAGLSQLKQDAYCQKAKLVTAFAGYRAKMIRKPSLEAAKDIIDNTLDFVFIDADHSYEGCKADIEAWYPKLKKSGLLSGHDYNNIDYPCFGVDKAVDKFVEETGNKLELGENFTWFIRCNN